jgi:DNA helicase-2/ATP-dependent DNA helicase PcrA
LLADSHRNICVVGDEDQSIYGWRGANIRNILDFEKDFPGTTVIRLEQNYRSTKSILEAAGAVIAHNKERIGKSLWTEAGAGEPISIYQAYSGENEALFVADAIEKLLGDNPNDRVAILYRTNFQSRQIEEALRRYNRKYLVVGGLSFYQRAEVKDMLAYLRVLLTPQDSLGLLRIINTPARGIGKTTVEQIEQFAADRQLTLWEGIVQMLEQNLLPPRADAALRAFRKLIDELSALVPETQVHDLLNAILDRTGYKRILQEDDTPESESRLGNLNELVNAATEAAERGEGITEFLDHAALVADADAVDARAQISLLTMHNAKGLEFPIVFITGMEDGLFPHTRALESRDAMEEERRLCYVAMTRAEKRLFLTYAKYRRRFGGGESERCKPSLFLNEVPKQLTRTVLGISDMPQVDLYAERHEVRETVKRNLYTGKTYNSLDNINQFFAERGTQPKPKPGSGSPAMPPTAQVKNAAPVKKKPFGTGSTIQHPKYGRGTVLRREGDGEDAKLTVSFPGYGLKKIVEKYAGIKPD